MKFHSLLISFVFSASLICFQNVSTAQIDTQKEGAMKITSSAFEPGAGIPKLYTCDGQNISPPLEWTDVPAGVKGLALISDDPDAPMGTWVHWIVYNIPAEARHLAKNILPDPELFDGTFQGKNSSGKIGYAGPCPPSGKHRYYFKLYALDVKLELKSGAKKSDLLKAMEGHVAAEAELMGTYQR